MSDEVVLCQLCGEPMPEGEEMFNYHGYSGPCPKKKDVHPAIQMAAYAFTGDAPTPKPTSTPHTPEICKGFMVEVRIHTDDGRQVLSDPEKVSYLVGTKFDAHGLVEEIDYTLEVRRIYEQ